MHMKATPCVKQSPLCAWDVFLGWPAACAAMYFLQQFSSFHGEFFVSFSWPDDSVWRPWF